MESKSKAGDSYGKRLLNLFLTFLKIGAFTFGGGYAMIPLIQRETVEKYGWISDEDILEIIAIAESTPGPIAINSATFVGYRVGGFWGAFLATFGVVLPSYIIITLISMILSEFQNLEAVTYAFRGIRAGVLALILKALWTMAKKCKKDAVSLAIIAFSFVAAAILNFNVLVVIIISAIIGLSASFVAARRNKA